MTKITVLTQGCSYNRSDSEVMAGILKKSGFTIIKDVEEAELIIFNTCVVKGPTVNYAKNQLKKLKNKKIIVAGCIAQTAPKWLKEYSLIGVDQIHNIVQIVEETLNGNIVKLIARANEKRLGLPSKSSQKFIKIIPICKGCLGNCAYCKTKQARGNLFSYSIDKILYEAKKGINNNAKELWITAQDTGCYGKDIIDDNDCNLPTLIKKIAELNGDFKIRIGMMNPNFAKEFIDELIEIFKLSKVFKFLHLPLQAGSNEVLKNMNRRYKVEDFIEIIERIRESIPEITIATDIICGFPEETKEQFQETLAVVEKIKPDVINISRFWKMPKTKAAEMKQIKGSEIKNRSRQLTSLFEWISFQKNKELVGKEEEIFFIDSQEGMSLGRTSTYKPVQVKGNYKGQRKKVKVYKNSIYSLHAKIIN